MNKMASPYLSVSERPTEAKIREDLKEADLRLWSLVGSRLKNRKNLITREYRDCMSLRSLLKASSPNRIGPDKEADD